MKRAKIDVPATSANLGPGFDCLGLALELCNKVEVEYDETSERVQVEAVTGAEKQELDAEDNLICNAYRHWSRAYDQKLPGARFRLDLNVPMARGLGTSAAAIVAGLAAASFYVSKKLDRQAIIDLASLIEGHADNVAASVLGGITVAIPDDQRIRALHVANHLSIGVALFVPDRELSTEEARSVLPNKVPFQDAAFDAGRIAYLVTALMWGRWEELRAGMHDRLHQPYRRQLIPGLFDVIEAANAAGAYGAALSGGGPSVIALTPPDSTSRVAEAMDIRGAEISWPGRGIASAIREHGAVVLEIDDDTADNS